MSESDTNHAPELIERNADALLTESWPLSQFNFQFASGPIQALIVEQRAT